jgi:altronate hydrolase
MQAHSKVLKLMPDDAVALALSALKAGEASGLEGVVCRQDIPAGHKLAVRRLSPGEAVTKYGQVIGFAAAPIRAGEHVHTHNVRMKSFRREAEPAAAADAAAMVPAGGRATFNGIPRADGRVGTRNYVGVLATVSCAASVAHFIADAAAERLLPDFPAVDGIVALGHGDGCCTPVDGEGLNLLQRTLAGFARHPNFGAILWVGLGCEVNLIQSLLKNTGLETGRMMRTLEIQSAGGTRQAVAQGVAAVGDMLPRLNDIRREPVSVEHLVLGLECGGSDAYSGITANPALGAAVDMLVQHGGTAILSETPEIYGAEHLLARRAVNREVGEKLMQRIRWWESYTKRNGAIINNNPTPGNKAGGLTTILEKSLGAVAKGGTSPLKEVYRYAEAVSEKGLVFMDTPGYDPVSVTGMIAGGANMICFTTGCGTVCGFKPVPTLKLASSTAMYRRLSEDMDLNCGRIVDGEASVGEMGRGIFERLLETASGRKTRSEIHGFGGHEFVPWHMGAVL